MKSINKERSCLIRRKGLVLILFSVGHILAACGGGGGGDAAPSTASGSASSLSASATPAAAALSPAAPTTSAASIVARGPVTAIGGITVNDVRYDDRMASVKINGQSRSINDIRVGMMVEIEGERHVGTNVATARSIISNSFAEGKIDAIDRASRTITMMGTVIKVPVSTVFEGWSGWEDPLLKLGDYAEVHGLPMTGSAGAVATRIEKKSASALGLENVSITGTITQVNPVLKTFNLSGTTVAFSNARIEHVGTGLADGMTVRVEGVPSGPGVISATEINGTSLATDDREGFGVEQEGIMSGYDSPTARFKVNGILVDASNARMDGILADQARVKVQGVLTGGVLVATKVERLDQGVGDSGRR